MDRLTNHPQDRTTYGLLDVGGASTQIAFEPSLAKRNNPENSLIEVRPRPPGGEEIVHRVFVATWFGYGTNHGREQLVVQAIITFGSCLSMSPDPLQMRFSVHISRRASD